MKDLTLLKYTTEDGKIERVCILEEAQHQWKDIASLICSDANKVTAVEQQCNGVPKECLRKILTDHFINNAPMPEDYSHNWTGLLSLLVDVKLEVLSKRAEVALSMHALK